MNPSAAAAGEQAITAQLDAIWQRYKPQALERLATIENAATALVEHQLTEELRKPAHSEAHKLAGTLGCFGFAKASQLAKKIEMILQIHSSRLRHEEALQLSEHFLALRAELVDACASAQPDLSTLAGAPSLLVVSGDKELREGMLVEAMGWRTRTERAADLLQARALISAATPSAVVFDLSAESDAGQLWQFLQELSSGLPHVVVVVICRSGAVADRLQAAQCGAHAFFDYPVALPEVLLRITELLRCGALRGTRVLALAADAPLVETVENVSRSLDLWTAVVADPLRLMAALEESNPEVLLVDAALAAVKSVDLCRVVRSHMRWHSLPVITVIAERQGAALEGVFLAGADDYLVAPVSEKVLSSCLRNRVQRSRAARSSNELDALTGLATAQKAAEVLDYFVRLATRQRAPLGIALIEVDQVATLARKHGQPASSEVVRQLGLRLLNWFRKEDIVARWGGERFLVGMYGMSRDTGVHRIADLLERWRQQVFAAADGSKFQATFSAGVAQYPEDGIALQNVLQSAEGALLSAGDCGGNRVVPAGWEPQGDQPTRVVDVCVVDDDEALVAMLLPSLQTRGYRTIHFPDGDSALRALMGRNPQVSAKVVLLDVEMPGIDGYSVLRSLAVEGLLRRTRVIMFTVRAHESEVVSALEDGAFDHISKPFSVPVLMQRIRRAIEV